MRQSKKWTRLSRNEAAYRVPALAGKYLQLGMGNAFYQMPAGGSPRWVRNESYPKFIGIVSMPKAKDMNVRVAQAVSLVLEQNPERWTAHCHTAMLRYTVLACSDKAKADLSAINKFDGQTTLTVNWKLLKDTLEDESAITEQSNFYKRLQDLEEMPKVTKQTTRFA